MRTSGLLMSMILGVLPLGAAAQDLVPAKRFALSQDIDLPGGDIASAFDTTLDACQRACLANTQCDAITFNTRNGSCFLKSGPGAGEPYAGAFSGFVLAAEDGAQARAKARRGELAFVQDWEIEGIIQQAANLANDHLTNDWTAPDLMTAAADAEMQGDFDTASRYVGAAINLTDAAGDWAEYARLLLVAGEVEGPDQRSYRDRAYFASVNAYLRAGSAPQQHSILVTMAEALEKTDRGRDTVQALRLAQSLQTRDDTAAYLAQAAGQYGFRIVENRVESDSARPRICVNFSEDLVKSGVDYTSNRGSITRVNAGRLTG